MDEHSTERGPVSEASKHPTTMNLEQLAEGVLPNAEALEVRRHVDTCRRCALEVETVRSLIAMLDDLPRFAPSAAFADAVMARVRIEPVVNPVLAFLRRLVPSTRRGWVILGTVTITPAVALLATIGLMLIQPLVTPAVLWQWFLLRVQVIGQGALGWVSEVLYGPETWNAVAIVYSTLEPIPAAALVALATTIALGVPLSAWGLVKLTRTPGVNVTYANS